MKNAVISDQELISKYLQGEEDSLVRLIRRHQRKVYAYIMMTVKDDQLADDIFQDTFIKVLNTLRSGAYKEEGKFIQWVMRISHNLIIDHFRRNKRLPMVERGNEDYDIFEMVRISDPSIEEQIITDQVHEDIRCLIELLPPEQKEVLIMRHYYNLSFKEIAESTQVSINTALGRMRYALINLRKLIKEKNLQLSLS